MSDPFPPLPSVGATDPLKQRPWARLAAATLWSSFIGACLLLLADMVHLLGDDAPPTLASQSLFFFTVWLIGIVPAAVAGLLTMPPAPRAPKDAP